MRGVGRVEAGVEAVEDGGRCVVVGYLWPCLQGEGWREGGRETKQNDNKQNAVNETTASTL